MIALPIIMTLIFGAPTFAAMTPLLWTMFALQQIPTAVKIGKVVYVVANSPAFRAWAAANGAAAIRLQPGLCSVDLYGHRSCY